VTILIKLAKHDLKEVQIEKQKTVKGIPSSSLTSGTKSTTIPLRLTLYLNDRWNIRRLRILVL
jgi:hypothetical protein